MAKRTAVAAPLVASWSDAIIFVLRTPAAKQPMSITLFFISQEGGKQPCEQQTPADAAQCQHQSGDEEFHSGRTFDEVAAE